MEGYKKLLSYENNNVYLDGQRLVEVASMDIRSEAVFFDMLHYKLVNDRKDSCRIVTSTEYKGLNANTVKALYVKED